MGEGGKFVVFDDPHNVEEAESDEVRDETVRKINLGLPTRVRDPKGGIVVMMQRLHERDFSQSCIDSGDWVHLCLPAFYEYDHPHVSKTITLPSGRVLKGDDREDPKVMRAYEKYKNSEDKKDQEKAKIIANAKNGKLLFPSLFDEERLKSIAEPLGEYGQAGQLQQRPVPREGGMFKLKWFDGKYIDQDELPRLRVIVRGYDLAGTEDPKSPYTCGVRMSMDAKGNYYVEHVDRYKANPGEVEENIKARASTDGRTVYIDVPQDPGQAGKAQVKAYSKLLAGYAFSYSPESGSKVKRAEPFAAQAFAGNVYIVRGGWNQDYLDELIIFPGGSYADQVDASSRAFAKLLQLGGMVNIGIVSGSY
jgi:predicted phage terminase large subunit-like protein